MCSSTESLVSMCGTGCISVYVYTCERLFKNQQTNETIFTVYLSPRLLYTGTLHELYTEQPSPGKQLNVTLIQSLCGVSPCLHIHTYDYATPFIQSSFYFVFCKSLWQPKNAHNTKESETLYKKSNTHYWPWLLYNIVLVAAWSNVKTFRLWQQVLIL